MEFEGVSIQHFIPGRVRLKVDAVRRAPEFARQVEDRLATVPGITAVEANALTGGVLVCYDQRQLLADASVDALLSALRELFPGLDIDFVRSALQARR